MKGRRVVGLALACAAALAACTLDNPLGRSLGWFRYLDAADIRDVCAARAGERYRLIYNAVWGQQVRSYDIAAGPGDGGATLAIRVFFPENLNDVDLLDPLALYRGRTATVALSPADLAGFRDALHASDFDGATPQGLVLRSDSFYWTAASCRDGVFHYNAYAYPSPRFAALHFDRWLFAHDPTGVPIAAPVPVGPRPQQNYRATDTAPAPNTVFDMTVGANGLVGVGSPF
jgi:hypothetical protein